MTITPSRTSKSLLKPRLIASIQIILQGITPLALAITPTASYSAPSQHHKYLQRSISPAQRAVIEAEYISRTHFTVGHVMEAGETLESVAKNYYVSVATLREINRIRFPANHDFYTINVGNYLMVPQWKSPEEAAIALANCYSQQNVAGHFLRYPASHQEKEAGSQAQATSTLIINKPAIWDDINKTGKTPLSPVTTSTLDEDKQVAQWLTHTGSIVQNGNTGNGLKNMAIGSASHAASANVENWLNQFGHARIQMGVNDKMHLDGSSADLLLPLQDKDGRLTYTQLGVHDKDRYTTANIGIGQRWFSPDYMVGYNAFIDQELRNNHTRAGLGIEYWRNYFKAAGNTYFGLTGWKASRTLEDYEEKAASGFDVRSEGYLPALPQLGVKLSYEQYFGQDVGLFGKDKRQQDPFAVSAGINYTPVPMVTAGVDYKQGKEGMNDTQFSLQFSYLFGVPLQEQLSADRVDALRTLNGSRLEFVNRNNNMVMQYRKMEMISLSLPKALRGAVQSPQTLVATVKTRHGLSRIQWDDSALIAAGGSIKAVNNIQYQITLPSKPGSYPLSAVAFDGQGNASNSATTLLTADDSNSTSQVTIASFAPDITTAQADGHTPVTWTLTASKGANGSAEDLTGYKIQWRNTGVGELSAKESPLDSQGKTQVVVTSKIAGKVSLTATLVDASGAQADQKLDNQVKFVSNYLATLTATPAKANADGNDTITWAVKMTDNGSPLPGYQVKWAHTGVGELSATQSTTDTDGIAKVTMTSKTPGSTHVTATLLDQSNSEVAQGDGDAQFVAQTATNITLTSDQKVQWTDKTVALQAEVKDQAGAAVPAQMLKWDITGCADCQLPSQPTTDAQGKLQDVALTLNAGANEGERTVKLCTTDVQPVCSNPLAVTFYKVPEITGYKTLGGTEKTGKDFNEVRIKNGEFDIIKTGSNDLTYSWNSSITAVASVSDSGRVTLLADGGGDITLSASKDGLETRTTNFTIRNQGAWYSLSATKSVYAAVNTVLCPAPLHGVDNVADFNAVATTWGEINQYSKISSDPFIDVWIDNTAVGDNSASIYGLAGSNFMQVVDLISNSTNSWALCK
jgi:intimin